jgi:hypothetical protein
LFAGPHPIRYPSGFFRWGHYRGYPRGSTFGVAPLLGAEPGWNEEPTPNFGVMACVGSAAGRRTYTHTHFHLYIVDSRWQYQQLIHIIFLHFLFFLSTTIIIKLRLQLILRKYYLKKFALIETLLNNVK